MTSAIKGFHWWMKNLCIKSTVKPVSPRAGHKSISFTPWKNTRRQFRRTSRTLSFVISLFRVFWPSSYPSTQSLLESSFTTFPNGPHRTLPPLPHSCLWMVTAVIHDPFSPHPFHILTHFPQLDSLLPWRWKPWCSSETKLPSIL